MLQHFSMEGSCGLFTDYMPCKTNRLMGLMQVTVHPIRKDFLKEAMKPITEIMAKPFIRELNRKHDKIHQGKDSSPFSYQISC